MKDININITDEEYEAFVRAMGRHIAKTGEVYTPDSFADLVFRKGVESLTDRI